MTAKSRSTTRSRPRKETVAEPQEVEGADEVVAETPPDVVEEPTPTVLPPIAADMGNGFCDNHADRPAVVKTNFRWAQVQRFCAQCLPPHYRHLL